MKKTPESLCSTFFCKGAEFINIAKILRDPHITSLLPTASVKFPIPIITYKLGLPLSTYSPTDIASSYNK